jgi:hypothetical protein
VLNVRTVADPCRVELPGKQHRRNFLIGPPLHELDRPPKPLGEIRLKQRQQLKIGIEKQRIKADANSLGRGRGGRRPKESGCGEASEDVPPPDPSAP